MPLGGEQVDVADVDGLDHDGTADSSVGTAATNFTSPTATVRTALKGHLVSFGLSITSTNAINLASAGNTTDTTIFTLDAAYRPSEQRRVAIIVNGSAVAGGFIQTGGTVVVAVSSHNIAAGSVLALSDTWLMP